MESEKDRLYGRFVSLFTTNERGIRAFVRSLLLYNQDVDDVMQEVALACWKKFDSFDPEGSDEDFTRWACVIARFAVLRHRRNCARDRLVLSEEVIAVVADDAMNRLEKSDQERKALEQCISKMPQEERQLLLSVYSPGESVAKIATDTGQKARRLYSKLNALRSMLADCVRLQLAKDTEYECPE